MRLRLAVMMFVVVSGRASAQRPLAGDWKLDKSRSTLSGRMGTNAAAIDQTMHIAVDSVTICATSVTTGGPLGRVESVERYVADSVDRTFEPQERVDSRSSTGRRSSRWSPSLGQLSVIETMSREMGGQRQVAQNTHTWRISANGDTLVIASETRGPRGTIPTRRTFARMKDSGASRSLGRCAPS